MHRAVLFPPEGLRRVIVHGDHFAGRNNLDRQIGFGVLRKLCAHGLRLAHKQNTHPKLACRQHTAFHFRTWCMVPAHGVNSDGNHGILPAESAKREKSKPTLVPPCPCSSRSADTPGAAASFHDNSGICPVAAWPENRWPAVCWSVFWNAFVLG